METWYAVIISQIPLGIACILAVYEIYRIRKNLDKNLLKLSDELEKLNKNLAAKNKNTK